jgi:hypothetical protein
MHIPEELSRENSIKGEPRPRSYSLSRPQKARPLSGIPELSNPGFLFLQLQHNPINQLPILVPEDDFCNRAISILDRTPSIDLHKIGIVYISNHQSTEIEILTNQIGSPNYEKFLLNIGSKFPLLNTMDIYTGGALN